MNFDQMYRDLMDEAGVKYPNKSDYTTYFAYKGGESKKFDNYEEAKKFSNNIESNVDKNAYEAARKAYNQASSEAEAKVIQAMKKEIGGYGDNEQDNKLFDLVYGKAYEDGHSSGFNEIYNCLLDYDDLIQRTLEIVKSKS
jgi:hypothetical protein